KSERYRIAREKLDLLGMADRATEKVTRLSGGEQQRVAIARALVNDPKVILADEPTGNLDTQNRDMVMDILQRLHKMGHTIIMVTHDMDLLPYASSVVRISDGKIV
ncbi:MAG: hypothetical protein DBY43_01605, partial [Clostridiaceae bacterium]